MIPKGVNKFEFAPDDGSGNFSGARIGIHRRERQVFHQRLHLRHMPMMTMKKGERVRWYLVALGEQFSVHTPHWHGNVVLQDGKRTDVVRLMQAQMVTVDMVPDNPGTWMFHCHIDDHMDAGMVALYKVEP